MAESIYTRVWVALSLCQPSPVLRIMSCSQLDSGELSNRPGVRGRVEILLVSQQPPHGTRGGV